MTDVRIDGRGSTMGDPAALRIAIIGQAAPDECGGPERSAVLARHLQAAGHEVVVVSWTHRRGAVGRDSDRLVRCAGPEADRAHTVRSLSWARPDSWVRTGRRLQHVDSIIVMDSSPAVVPVHLAVLRAAHALAGRPGPRPQSIVLARAAGADLLPVLLRRADATVVPDPERARWARALGAQRVSVAPLPDESSDITITTGDGAADGDPGGAWARFLGMVEALSVDPSTLLPPVPEGPRPAQPEVAGAARLARLARRPVAVVVRAGRTVGSRVRARRAVLQLRPTDLPGWVRPTDALTDPVEADAAWRLARLLGLPRTLDRVAAWAALGALAAILRIGDDGGRSAVVVDEGGSRSVLSRWARCLGFAPIRMDFTGARPSVTALDVDTGSLDVVVRVHPGGCDGADIDHVLEQAAWALRAGGLLVVTVPLAPPTADGAVGPADVRAIAARAQDLGLVLVGDLDGDVTARMRAAARRARADSAAYGLVRLVFRRR